MKLHKRINDSRSAGAGSTQQSAVKQDSVKVLCLAPCTLQTLQTSSSLCDLERHNQNKAQQPQPGKLVNYSQAYYLFYGHVFCSPILCVNTVSHIHISHSFLIFIKLEIYSKAFSAMNLDLAALDCEDGHHCSNFKP